MINLVYAGSPDISAKPLQFLLEQSKKENSFFKVVAVLTNPPSVQGRKSILVPTPVAKVTEEFNINNNTDIKIFTPLHLDSELREQISLLNPDILVCFAYGKIFGPKFLGLYSLGGINLHPSLLPKYRGATPVPAAILNQEKETGITIQYLGEKMDEGDILLQTKIELTEKDTAESVLQDVSEQGGKLLEDVLQRIVNKTVQITKQDNSKATYCDMLTKEQGKIDWNESVYAIDAKVRAFFRWPGTFTFVNGQQLRIIEAFVYNEEISEEQRNSSVGKVLQFDKKNGILIKTADGVLCVKTLQWQSKKEMNYKDFMNGSRDFIGSLCE